MAPAHRGRRRLEANARAFDNRGVDPRRLARWRSRAPSPNEKPLDPASILLRAFHGVRNERGRMQSRRLASGRIQDWRSMRIAAFSVLGRRLRGTVDLGRGVAAL